MTPSCNWFVTSTPTSRADLVVPAGSTTSRRRRLVLGGLGGGLVIAALISASMGSVEIPPSEVLGMLARRLGSGLGAEPSAQAEAVLSGIRLPRIALGTIGGACLGVAGAGLQGVLRNPLADPQLLAVGPGASLGAVAFMLALGATAPAALAGATVGAVVVTRILRRFTSSVEGAVDRLVLAGVALGLVLSAWVGFLVFAADRAAVPPVDFWLLGSVAGATWRTAVNVALVGVFGFVLIAGAARSLDVLALGESEARHVGVDVDLVVQVVLLGCALTVGAAVGAAGVVGFVGLVVPHVMRRWLGPSHRPLLAASALGGALLVTVSDLAARTVAAPIEIPVGLITTAVGGPFFLWLLMRTRSTESP